MADDEFPGHLSGPDVDLFLSGCFSDPLSWSEMRRRFAILSVFVFLWAAPAFSQGCAMCRSSAEATSKDGRKAISKGVVILLVPPLGIMTVGVWMAFRYAKRRDIEQSQQLGFLEWKRAWNTRSEAE
jgi:hypothetical protein